MKRKRSPDSALLAPPKKLERRSSRNRLTSPCRLLQILAQYGLLESITSYLFPPDLYALAATSKAAYRSIFPRQGSRTNLLKKMSCDGSGISIRNACHKKSKFFYDYNCTEHAECGTVDPDRNVESRPCVCCGVSTCNECRIHCVYQTIFQPPSEPDELPCYSGFVLLSGAEMGIMSPKQLLIEGAATWDKPTSHHDEGFLDLPLECSVYAPPEWIGDIIGRNLGSGPLEFANHSNLPHPTPVIQAFWDATEQRKRLFCTQCFDEEQTEHNASGRRCKCTLKARYLDRWLCLKCYQREEQVISEYPRGAKGDGCSPCSCGQEIDPTTTRTICLWCCGEVIAQPITTSPPI